MAALLRHLARLDIPGGGQVAFIRKYRDELLQDLSEHERDLVEYLVGIHLDHRSPWSRARRMASSARLVEMGIFHQPAAGADCPRDHHLARPGERRWRREPTARLVRRPSDNRRPGSYRLRID